VSNMSFVSPANTRAMRRSDHPQYPSKGDSVESLHFVDLFYDLLLNVNPEQDIHLFSGYSLMPIADTRAYLNVGRNRYLGHDDVGLREILIFHTDDGLIHEGSQILIQTLYHI